MVGKEKKKERKEGKKMVTNRQRETEIFWANTNRLETMEGGKGDDEGYMAKAR